MVREGNVLATSFHPELCDDPRVHRYFLDMVERAMPSNVEGKNSAAA
jgi:5'-phosphate synthase pdxT subunit